MPDRPTQRERGRGYREERIPVGGIGGSKGFVTRRRRVVQLECPEHDPPYRYDAFEDAPECPFCATGSAAPA